MAPSYGLTIAYTDAPDNKNYSFNSYAARGMNIVTGSISNATLASTGGGTAITFPGLATVAFCKIISDSLASDLIMTYNYSPAALYIYVASDLAARTVLASDANIASARGYFFAVGPGGV